MPTPGSDIFNSTRESGNANGTKNEIENGNLSAIHDLENYDFSWDPFAPELATEKRVLRARKKLL